MLDIHVKFIKIGNIDKDHAMGAISGHVKVDGESEEITMELLSILNQLEKEVPEELMAAIELSMDKEACKMYDFSTRKGSRE